MRLEKVEIDGFRNLEKILFFPHPHLTFLSGANGQGKTSILEAIHYLSSLRSFKGSDTTEMIAWDKISSLVNADGILEEKSESPLRVNLGVLLKKNEGRVATINGKPYKNITSYLSQRFNSAELGFHSVVFNPADHELVRGEPQLRRSFLDRAISAENIGYLKSLSRYQRLLLSRNALLKRENLQSSELLAFTEPWVKEGAWIALKRLEWILKINSRLGRIAKKIAPMQSESKIFYISSWAPETAEISFNNNKLLDIHFSGQCLLPSLETLERAFWKQVSLLGEAERKSQFSLVGPHRDDWGFFLKMPEKTLSLYRKLKGHGSQGEVRTALLALKFSEIELFRESTGHRPVLLLDDLSSELDLDRRAFLFRFLSETDLQVIVTLTEAPPKEFGGLRCEVRDGKLFYDSNNNQWLLSR